MVAIEEYLLNITLGQIVQFTLVVVAIISAFVEWNSKIPFHPLTQLMSWVGKGLMKGTSEEFVKRLDTIEDQQKSNNEAITELDKKMEEKFNDQQRESDEKEAKRLRYNIICFSDSCRVHNKHTKNHFENVMRDYDDYMEYCNKHNFDNHFIEEEHEYIKAVYQECLKENKFL